MLAFMRKRTVSSDAVLLFCWSNPSRVFLLQRFSHFDQILPDKVYWLSGRLLPISSKMLSTAFTFSAHKRKHFASDGHVKKEKIAKKERTNIHFGKAQTPSPPKCCKSTKIKKKWHLSTIKVLLFHKDPNKDLILDFLQNFLCQAALSIQLKHNLSG